MATITELENELIAAGYKPEPPSSGAEAIDGDICQQSTCEACGQQGLLYHPFSKTGSYRAFSECSNCAKIVEF